MELSEFLERAAQQWQDLLRPKRSSMARRKERRRRASTTSARSELDDEDPGSEDESSKRGSQVRKERLGSTASEKRGSQGRNRQRVPSDASEGDLLKRVSRSRQSGVNGKRSSRSRWRRPSRRPSRTGGMEEVKEKERRGSVVPNGKDDLWKVLGNIFRPKQQKYSTLRPTKKIGGKGTDLEHLGEELSSGPLYFQGARVNQWNRVFFKLYYTGLQFFKEEEDFKNGTNVAMDLFFELLVLPTGNVCDILPNQGNIFSKKKYVLCFNTETDTFVFATQTEGERDKFVNDVEDAYSLFIDKQIRKKIMLELAMQVTDNPKDMSKTVNFKATAKTAASAQSHTARMKLDGITPEQVFREMEAALEEKFELDLIRLLEKRTMAKVFEAWRAFHTFLRTMP